MSIGRPAVGQAGIPIGDAVYCVHVITVSYNSNEALRQFASSLIQQESSNWRLTIVDNSDVSPVSPEELHELFSDEYRKVKLIRSQDNIGYMPALALGRKLNLGGEEEITLVANPDLEFGSLFIGNLIRLHHERPQSILAPSIRDSRTGLDGNPFQSEKPSVTSVLRGALFNPSSPLARFTFGRYRQRVESGNVLAHEIYAPHGAAISFPPEFFSRGGNLDYAHALFGEEDFVARQAAAIGVPVWYEPSLHVYHRAGHATGSRSQFVRAQQRAAGWRLLWESLKDQVTGR